MPSDHIVPNPLLNTDWRDKAAPAGSFKRQVAFTMPVAKSIPVRIFGGVLALLLFALPYEYCMDGTGYGFPFACFHPGHDDWGAYVINPTETFSDVIDPVNISAALVLWGIIYCSVSWYVKRKSNKKANKTEGPINAAP